MSIIYPQTLIGGIMDKIYGYKQKDVLALAEFLMQQKDTSLSSVFEEFGAIHGKAKGTVRNLYYALAKKSIEDKEFCQKYLNGKAIKIAKSKGFDENEEKQLIKTILERKTGGNSVRSIIMQMAGGDAKTALRYQNKFRNALKHKPELVTEIAMQIQGQGMDVKFKLKPKTSQSVISEQQFDKLKFEIDGLVQRISSKIQKENQYLKQRIGVLESENLKLIALLYGSDSAGDARKFFKSSTKKQFIN